MSVYDTPRVLDPFSNPSAYELAEARNWICECGCGEHVNRHGGPERNHCIFPDRKRHHSEVSRAWNYQLVAHNHHENCHTLENRIRFYKIQCDRYGREFMEGCLKQVPVHPSEIHIFLKGITE